ncbi:hypothetical protein [Aeromicrobium sp. Leaf245]|uniref:hypothetical protein n=1 Tax=Aeromicrobium sp. Leaf245 TaxID=1736306 RepID=UPI0006FCA3FA|nr:hypothetical protein [Aeromicrobium sp. Leaf245]KQO41864.1 hypothetical protein ASF05_12235 [Aeromicrobium sp. Leaf245]
MPGRRAEESDRHDLESFCCQSPEREWEAEVEDAIRGALGWQAERQDREVRLFHFNHDLSVVVGYEDADEHDPEAGIFVAFMGVHLFHQGNEYGPHAFDTLLPELRERALGGRISARVHPLNEHSKSALSKLNFGLLEVEEDYELWRTV